MIESFLWGIGFVFNAATMLFLLIVLVPVAVVTGLCVIGAIAEALTRRTEKTDA